MQAGIPYLVGETAEVMKPEPEVFIPAAQGPGLSDTESLGWEPAVSRYGDRGTFELKGHPTHSDWYDAGAARAFADAARKYGVDPALYIALGISESRLGKADSYNLPRIFLDAKGRLEELEKLYNRNAWGDQFPDWKESALDLIDFGARRLKQGLDTYPKDLLSGVQWYSGTGRKPYGGRVDPNAKFFGQKVKDIDFWRDKPQAKRVLAIYDILKRHEDLPRIIGEEE